MQFKFIQVVVSVITLLFVSAAPVSAETVREIWIEGHGYEAVLEENPQLSAAGTHYRGHFPEDPDSWVRISHLDSGWEGLAFVFGRMHTLGGSAQSDRTTSFSFSQLDAPQCGVDHIHGDSAITPDSLADTAMVQAVSANYDTLCSDKVDDACLMMELELAFDQQFQNRFEDDYESRAGAIVNMVEGFYADQFGIVFDTLSLTFMAEDLFTSSTDAGALLGDIRDKRAAGNISFLESDQSIFHFVSGRNFEGSTAGLAYVGTVCNGYGYASSITNAFDSNATTAVVAAHEIGHNLGASHDGPENNSCEAGEHIMSPYVSTSANSFSGCSFEDIGNTISQLPAVEQCFNFPADAGIAEVEGNPLEVVEGASFQTNFSVEYLQAAEAADSLAVSGMIGEDEGQLQGVTVDGNPCSLLDETSFTCSDVEPRAGLQLSINAVAGNSPTFSLLNNVTLASNSGEVKDILPNNDSLLTEITVAANDNDNDNTSSPDEPDDTEIPGRQPDSTSSDAGSGSGGGGGAVHWLWLVIGFAAVALRGRRPA